MANVALLVGLDEPKRKLVELITKEHGDVISLVGMGGLGKTTLAREVYGSQELRAKFDHFAWVTIQHPFNTEEFIESLAKNILANPGDNKLSDKLPKQRIKETVTEYLKDKKYFIVLDDMSNESEWTKIKDVLPMGNERRIIVTTRLRPLTESISHKSGIYVINKLSAEDALDLFYKAVYKTPNYNLVIDDRKSQDNLPKESKCDMNDGPSSTEITEENSKVQKQRISNDITEEEGMEIKDDQPNGIICKIKYGPSTEIMEEESEVQKQCITITITKEMNKHANLIVNSCDRLPLAIVTIGSLLYTKPKTSVEWKTIHDHLSTELDKNRDLGVVKNVLTSSYDRLPYHLKPCLLYLSVFHNHKEIRRSSIIRHWMADGYVTGDRKRMAQEVGKDYFNELMDRSLIQPSEMSAIINEDINRCNVHDIMYELILAKAMDENNVSLLQDESLTTMTDKVRHLVIIGGPCTKDKVLERVKLSHMRSLSIFGEVGDYLSYPRMKLGRVLDLEGTLNLNDEDLRSIGKLRHLKYLGLKRTKITKLPNSLGKLSELETLDIRNTKVNYLPIGLTKLHKLSYLRAGDIMGSIFHPPRIEYYIDHICDIFDSWEEKVNDKWSPTIQETARNIVGIIKFLCHVPLFPLFYLKMLLDSKTYRYSYGVRVPRGICKLRSLNIMGIIDIGESKSLAKEMQNLTNLRKLAVCGFTEKNGKTLAKMIDGLKHLRSLFLEAKDELGLRCCFDSVSSAPKYLQSLKLHSHLGKLPNWISFLENLEKIHFKYTWLTGEIKVIGKLPNLKILHLLSFSINDLKELYFDEGTFPMLQVMILDGLMGLESVSIEKTALKRLEQLKIRKCWDMRADGVLGLDFLEQLKEMEVVHAFSFNFFGQTEAHRATYQQRNNWLVSNLQEKLSKHPRKPILRVIKQKVSNPLIYNMRKFDNFSNGEFGIN